MIIKDPLSNLFSSIKNGYLSKKTKISQPNTNQNKIIINLLIKEGFIKSYRIISQFQLEIFLKYKNNKPVLTNITKISKPGRRIYMKNKDLFSKNHQFFLLSTSYGIVTNIQAKQLNPGGEVICKIF
jgi:small subunit ribosomal protein S8